jgi:tetratricopeptide (TPR) repeat protein
VGHTLKNKGNMAEIALRSYIKEIDESIEQEQLDQAIAHCRHILETYPKHLDTYRLLGKAYLEAKRYGDAADLFQRVLSAVPDDFVAHVGMSIVREDEGNLDASIWHMERAFETNPANPTIQQELRRLIGRRDGMEPHKVRLTRGALARMYAHGELYQQAVAELRSALVEDPERPDLQVLLANLYWRMNQRQEAVSVGKAILEKLPFCRDANRILAASLQGADKVEEAASYHRRLAALDPYAAFVESAMVDPLSVDPASVRLEKLAWSPGQSLTPLAQGRPVWATSLGEELKSQQAATPPVNLPSWLESQPSPEPAPIPAPRPPAEVVHPFAGAKAPPEAPIPEWMEEAGWYPSKGEAVEGPVEFSESELGGPPQDVEPAQPLAAAEMPGWLNEISPPSQPEQVRGGGLPDWMDDIPAAGIAAGAAVAGARREEKAPGPEPAAEEPAAGALEGAELPTWLDDVSPGASETIVYWLGDRDKPGGSEAAPPDLEAAGVPEGAPDWLQAAATEEMQFEPAAPGAVAQPAEDLPAWLSGVASAAVQEPETAEAAELPTWIDEAPESASLPELESGGAPTSAPAEEAPDWLRSILDTGAEAEATDEQPEPAEGEAWGPVSEAAWLEPETGAGQLEEAPDWLARLTTPGQEAEAADEALPPAAEAPVSAAAAAASVDWLRGLLDTSEEAPTPGEAEAEPEAWLRGLAEPKPEEPEVVAEAPSAAVGSDDWLRSMVAEPTETPGEQPSFELEQPEWLGRLVGPDSPEQPGASLEAPDWVKALAAMEPGPDEKPAVEAEEPAAPEWLGRVLGADAQPPIEPIEPGDEVEEPPPWLARPAEPGLAIGAADARGDASEEEFLPIGRLAAAAPPETPDWLREFADAAADETPAPATLPAAPTPPPPDLEYEGALDWLREGETGPIGPEEVGLAAASVASVANTPAGSVDDEEIFRWLDDLAQRQPDEAVPSGIIPRAELLPKEAAAPLAPRAPIPEEAEAGMEWLEQLAGESESAPAMPEPPPKTLPEEALPAIPVYPAPVEEVIAVEPTPPMPPQPERPASLPPEPEEEDITVWLKSLSMAQPQPAAPSTVAAAPPPVPAAPSAPAPAAAGPVQPIPEEPPKKPTWTPVDESWLQPAAPPVQMQPPAPVPPAAPPPAAVEPPVVLPATPPLPALPVAKPRAKAPGAPDVLARARQHLSHGDFAKASKDYSTVIKKKYELDTVITELRMAAEHFPAEAGLWQLLGDAYMRADRLDEAVEAYNRGIQAA